ncbi:MAG: sugar ABC transporter permease [Clostridia bacterium]|nr:sugar ABC transporter permease [Clostridia bacterium]MCI8979692.1 sugar ABC transporter permease [Clostridia bacterium]MCI9086425.1 sugar ABC transporter permease [Clostridia bacterium]NDO18399.1 sugar ABC transporter permease [Lachnospiraceae bacterium MD329]
MAKAKKVELSVEEKAAIKQKRWAQIKRDKWMYLLLLPGFLYFIVFKIVPMWGILISFKDYGATSKFFGAAFTQDWVGIGNFKSFFLDSSFLQLLRNTLIISGMNIVFFFPLPIILALLLNEMKVQWYKKVIQTLVYVPHFVSMVVIASITFMLVKMPSSSAQSGGALFEIVKNLTGKEMNALGGGFAIYWVLLIQNIWKETGWGTIIFLAALAGVDVEQYEAAIVDGANRFQQLIYITLPAILGTIVTMFILRMGSVLDTGFEQIILMQNTLNREKSETFDTYVYQYGRVEGNYGYSTAVGLFKSVISIICIQTANRLAKKAGQDGLF